MEAGIRTRPGLRVSHHQSEKEVEMIWHVLTIVVGVLIAASGICPSWLSDLVFGVLVIILASLALWSFTKVRRKAA